MAFKLELGMLGYMSLLINILDGLRVNSKEGWNEIETALAEMVHFCPINMLVQLLNWGTLHASY